MSIWLHRSLWPCYLACGAPSAILALFVGKLLPGRALPFALMLVRAGIPAASPVPPFVLLATSSSPPSVSAFSSRPRVLASRPLSRPLLPLRSRTQPWLVIVAPRKRFHELERPADAAAS